MKCKTVLCVLITLLYFARGQVDDSDFYSTTGCCRQKGMSEEECRLEEEDCMEASWETVNTTSGRFKMMFDFPNGNSCQKYVANLYLIENITSESQCKSLTSIGKKVGHTVGKTLKVKDWRETCTKMCDKKAGEFYFQFIFTGCYVLKLEIIVENNLSTIDFCPVYLKSEYKKQLLLDSKKKITAVEPASSVEFPARIQFNMSGHPWKEMWLVQSKLAFYFTNKETKITNQWQVWLQPDKTVSCHRTKSTLELPECELVTSNILELRLSKVEPGEYKYTISLSAYVDNRCKMSTLWLEESGRECKWTFDQTVRVRTKQMEESPTEHSYLHIYAPIICGVFLVLVFTLVAIRYAMKKKPLTVPVQAPTNVSVMGQRTAILLLYSRDCDAFMKLMESFRHLLEQATEFEIYDCYDPKRWAEIDLDQTAWTQRLTTHPDTRVIAVASRCASLRQRAHIDGTVIHFTTPLNTDKMFPYALRLLTDEMACIASYHRTFVVRFDGFSDDSDLYQVLNSYTRFVLPSHLHELISSLKQSKVDEITESWFNLEEGKVLQDDLNNLLQYKNQNANYLQDMLIKERTHYETEISTAIYT